jgi:hypothetical protein
MSDESREIAVRVFREFGAELKPGDADQLSYFFEAFEIYLERNAKYKDLWAQYGIEDVMLHVRSKFSRLERTGDIDDALDLLNYTVFWIRLKKREGVL